MASGQGYPGQNMNPQQRFGPQSNPMARFQQPMGYGVSVVIFNINDVKNIQVLDP